MKNALVTITFFALTVAVLAEEVKLSFPLVPSEVCNFPNDQDKNPDVAIPVTLTDADGKTATIRLPNGSTLARGWCLSPDGKYAYVTHQIDRYQMPHTQIERGWAVTNAVSVIDVEKKAFVNSVLLDDVDRGAANPWGIAVSKDGCSLYVAISGTHELMVIDRLAMHEKLDKYKDLPPPPKRDTGILYAADVPNDLKFLHGMKRRENLSTGFFGPREIRADEDGNVWMTGMDGRKTAIKFDKDGKKIGMTLEMSKYLSSDPRPTPEEEKIKLGERYFNDATLCHQSWFSCASCHPEGRIDGMNWDLLNDGIGNPKNTKSLLGAAARTRFFQHGTADGFKDKTSPTTLKDVVHRQFREVLFTTQDDEVVDAIVAYIGSLKPEPYPKRDVEAAGRGAKVYEKFRCAECHKGPQGTDEEFHDVGTKAYYDRRADCVTPPLLELWKTAPYLHDGRSTTLGELFRDGKHGIEDVTEAEIDDLVEYVLSL